MRQDGLLQIEEQLSVVGEQRARATELLVQR